MGARLPGRAGTASAALRRKVMAALSLRFAPEVRSPLAPWILYAVGTAAGAATAATTGRFGYLGNAQSAITTASGYQQVLNDLSYCAPLAVAAAALQVYRERVPGAGVTLAVLFLAQITIGAAAGGKQSYIIAVLAVAIPFTTARRRARRGPAAFMALGLAGLMFLLVVIPFNQAYRSNVRSASGGSLSVRQAFDAAPASWARRRQRQCGSAFFLDRLLADQDQGDRQSRDYHAAHARADRVREPCAAHRGAHNPHYPGQSGRASPSWTPATSSAWTTTKRRPPISPIPR